jgi:hypothetical protein
MDSIEEFSIILDDSESDSDSGSDIRPPNSSKTENEESIVVRRCLSSVTR